VSQRFVGFSIYREIFDSSKFWNSLKVTFLFCTAYTLIANILGLLLAIILNKRIRFRGFFRASIFCPYMISMVAVGLIWQFALNEKNGFVNYLLRLVGIGGIPWLRTPGFALSSLILIQGWALTGYIMMLLLAGLQGISRSYYESAEIDGAGGWTKFLHITIPLLRPTLFLAVLIAFVQGFTQSFALVNVITGGGPMHSTDILSYFIYRTAFDYFDLPRANALSIIGLGMLAVIGAVQFKFTERLRA
jgi:ABC-type sugar transport system permease subunit